MNSNLPPPFFLSLLLAPFFAATLCLCQEGSPVAYEAPPILYASELFDENLLAGPRHSVREEVTTEGFTNTIVIDSDFGVFQVHGNDRVPEKIREIYAIAGIRETKESDAYKTALKDAAKDSVVGAVGLLKNPVENVVGAGKGAARLIKGAKERVRVTGEGGENAEELKRFGSARREIAGQYGVDPYTSNEILRAEIDSLAAATGAGGLTFTLIKAAIPGGLGELVSKVSRNASLNEKLIEQGPFILRAENRDRLEEMGVAPDLFEEFLDHAAFSPMQQTVIAYSLAEMDAARGREEFIRMAVTAESEQDAYFYQRCAELLLAYHRKRSPVKAILEVEKFAAAFVGDGKLILPQLLDYGTWTEKEDRLSQSFAFFSREDLEITGYERVISGEFSPAAKGALDKLGIQVVERAEEAMSE